MHFFIQSRIIIFIIFILSFPFDCNKTAAPTTILIVVYLLFGGSYINFVFSTASGKYWRGSQERNSEGHLDSFYSHSSPKPSWEMEVYASCFVRMPNRLGCVDMTKSLPLTPLMISQDLELYNKPITVTLRCMKLSSLDYSSRPLTSWA